MNASANRREALARAESTSLPEVNLSTNAPASGREALAARKTAKVART
ncbi:hypothetical protein DB30_07819 [Enhygromyxa salina]|uniref:Uncharacterized protein n=1 Tax=Enhygromyxa salina TaxID=215803 RepID=A0A0C2CR09_9BACT|nr:hypothetical protein DB30_07819 [Enhygromyxa salina]